MTLVPEPTADDVHKIEKVLCKKLTSGRLQFKIRWLGHGAEDDSYVLASTIEGRRPELDDRVPFCSTPRKKGKGAAKGKKKKKKKKKKTTTTTAA